MEAKGNGTVITCRFIFLFALFSIAKSASADRLDKWTSSNPWFDGIRLFCSAYGNGLFVAAGQTETGECVIGSSSDGVTWVQRLIVPRADLLGVQLFDISYANGLFVAVGGIYGVHVLGNAVFTSANGISWASNFVLGGSALQGVAYGNGRHVIVGGTQSATSPDGAQWRYHDIKKALGQDRFWAGALRRNCS